MSHLDLGLDRGVTLDARYGHQVHIVERQFGQLRHVGLDENTGFRRVDAHREVIQGDLYYVLAHFLGVVGVVSQGLGVGDHDENLVETARILKLHAAAQGAYVMAKMETAGGAVSRQYDFFHSGIMSLRLKK